jgi:hypothetical protein
MAVARRVVVCREMIWEMVEWVEAEDPAAGLGICLSPLTSGARSNRQLPQSLGTTAPRLKSNTTTTSLRGSGIPLLICGSSRDAGTLTPQPGWSFLGLLRIEKGVICSSPGQIDSGRVPLLYSRGDRSLLSFRVRG